MSINICSYIVLLAILLQSALIYAQSERCYFCNTEVHGQGCNDPINPSQVQIQTCSDSEVVQKESYFTSIWSFFRGHSAEKRDTNTTGAFPDICLYMTYQFDFRNVSVRGCESDQRETSTGVLHICDYYRRLVPTRISNFNCTICTGNLCNHGNFVEESTPTTDSSQSISISLQLIIALLAVKILLL